MQRVITVGAALALGLLLLLAAPDAAAQQRGLAIGPPAEGAEPAAPPPRRASDISSALRALPRASVPADVTAAVDRKPPAGAPDDDLAHFFRARGQAAAALGRDAQSVEDHRQALVHARKAQLDLVNFLSELVRAEGRVGNMTNVVRLQEDRLRESGSRPGARFPAYNSLVHAHIRMGDIKKAEGYLKEAERLLEDAESWKGNVRNSLPNFRSHVLQARARFLEATGRLAEAEAAYRLGIKSQEQLARDAVAYPAGGPSIASVEAGMDQRIAGLSLVLMRQGRLAEAEIEARRALKGALSRFGRAGGLTASLVENLAIVLVEQGRFADAETLAREAEEIVAEATRGLPESGAVRRARLRVAQAMALGGKPKQAGELVGRLVGSSAGSAERLALSFEFDPILVAALARAGHGAFAEAAARKLLAVREAALGDKAYETAEARGFHGLALAATERKGEAIGAFRKAVPVLLELGRRGEGEIARGFRLQAILDAYMALLFELRGTPALTGTDVVAETFHLAEAARGRAVQRAVAAYASRAAARDPALAEMVRREQDLGRRIVGLYATLMETAALAADQQAKGAQAALREEIDKLTAERTRIGQDIAKRFPDYAELVDPRPATLAEARAALRSGEALVALYVGETRSYVWAVPAQGQAAAAMVPRDAAAVAAAVAALRRSLDPQMQSLSQIPAFDVAGAHALYRDFLEPVASGWRDAKSLLVVPQGPLAQLPFALLVTGDKRGSGAATLAFAEYRDVPWLVRQAAITQLPSVATLSALRRLPPGRADRRAMIGFGDPVFAPEQVTQGDKTELAARGLAMQINGVAVALRSVPRTAELDSADLSRLPRLPDTADELKAVAAALGADPSSDLFLGPLATEENVAGRDLRDRRVVMFATHGLVSGELDGLTQPALALSSPRVTGGKGDGLLTLEKVLGLRLDADWVVLSACNTASAAGGEGGGAEAVSGLGRAFFYAGARAVLVSNWPVETTAATALTTGLFQRQAADPSLSRAEALRRSMLALIDEHVSRDAAGRPAFSYAHPIFWGPFSLVGDGWSTGAAK